MKSEIVCTKGTDFVKPFQRYAIHNGFLDLFKDI